MRHCAGWTSHASYDYKTRVRKQGKLEMARKTSWMNHDSILWCAVVNRSRLKRPPQVRQLQEDSSGDVEDASSGASQHAQ